MQEYIKADQRIHLLCQVLAKINRNFVSEKEDFSHSTLSFDPLGERIVSHWIKAKKGNFILTLDLQEFNFAWLDASFRIIKKYSIFNKTISALENEISSDFENLGIGGNGFPKKLKYKIPDYSFKSEKFQTFESPTVNKWIYYRNIANEACARFLRHLMTEEDIRIWPHHFDTGIFKEISGKIGIGFGLAMQDSVVDSPYFYLSGYLLEGELSFENLPPLKFGKWDIGEWNGAVLPIIEIDNLSGCDKRNAIDEFTKSALNWYWNSTLK